MRTGCDYFDCCCCCRYYLSISTFNIQANKRNNKTADGRVCMRGTANAMVFVQPVRTQKAAENNSTKYLNGKIKATIKTWLISARIPRPGPAALLKLRYVHNGRSAASLMLPICFFSFYVRICIISAADHPNSVQSIKLKWIVPGQ